MRRVSTFVIFVFTSWFVLTSGSLFFVNEALLNIVYAQGTVTYDKSGIPSVDYGYQGDIYIGPQRNPLNVALKALEHYDIYNRTHNEKFLEQFLNSSDWLVDNAVSKGNYSVLEYRFVWPMYNMQPPWYSGMAQAKALEVLIKAHEITGDKKYLDTAKPLLNAFFVEVKDGGVTYKTPQDGWWYEEYAGIGSKEPRVLNGMTHALLGIYKYYQYTQDPAAKYLFDQGLIALKNNLPRYEYTEGNYSTYDILSNGSRASPLNYHLSHVRHFGMLYDIAQDPLLKLYHDKWADFRLPDHIEDRLKRTGKHDLLLSACSHTIRDPLTQQALQIYGC
jgi:heparosan-N-sulfate-glucuronate 5-epimerase